MSTLLEKTYDLVEIAGSGAMADAIDKYYAEDVVIREATGETAQGKEAQKERMEQWAATIKEIHGGGVHAVTSNEEDGVTMVESWIEATFADRGRMMMEEVERYRWENGKIVDARFYYHVPGA